MLELIKSLDLDVLCLQEVGHADFDAFSGLFETAAFSLEVVRSDGHTSGRSGVAVLARRHVRLKPETADLLYGLHQPERGLGVKAVWEGRPLRLLSWHAPNAKQHGRELKEAAYRAVIEHIAGWSVSGIAAMDTNFPEDPTDAAAGQSADLRPAWRFHWDLLGVSRQHELLDLHRELLRRAGVLTTLPEQGPLALTYRAGGKDMRFDRILATADLQAERVDHLYEKGIAAGSDHGIVAATITAPTPSAQSV